VPSSPPLGLSLETLNYLLAGGAFSIVVLGIGEFFVPRKRPINYVTAAIGLSFGLAILDYLAQTLGLYEGRAWILYLYYPLMLLTGTLLFFFFTLLVERDFKIRFPYTLMFLPVIIVTALMMPYYLQSPEAKIAQIPIHKTSDPLFHAVYFFIYRNLESWVIGAIAFFIIRTVLLIRLRRIRWEPVNRRVLGFAFVFLGVLFLYLWVNFFPSEYARKLSILVSIIMVYPLYFFQKSNPHLFVPGDNAPAKESPANDADLQAGKYRRSTKLAGLDTAALVERLDSLMVEKRRFTDSMLTLPLLSEELGLSPHQLSELLNSQLGTNFRQYINQHRVELAKRLLAENPDRTILDIAFDCGFASKSPFNVAFFQISGKTPSEWRKELAMSRTKTRNTRTEL